MIGRVRFVRGTRRACSAVLGIFLLAAPVAAMTVEDCRRIQSLLAKTVPAVDDLRIAPRLSDDGWCRVIDGPFGGGLEWRFELSGDQFEAAFRQNGLEFDG